MLTVVKVGGGIAREAGEDALRALCDAIGAAGRGHRLLVVPGGGEFADAVRESDRRYGLSDRAAHRMAILAMEQFAWLLSELIPGAVRSASLRSRRPGLGAGSRPRPAWTSSCRLRGRSPRTRSPPGPRGRRARGGSCSSSRWTASTASGPRRGRRFRGWACDELSGLGGVDAHLAQVLSVETWVINGRAPERLG